MIYSKNIAAQLLGTLYKHPEFLAQTDKYILSPDDFPERLHRIVFSFIFNMYHSGVEVFDLNTFIREVEIYPELSLFFKENKGQEFILTASELGKVENFDFYYNKVKKMSLLRALRDGGFDISEWFIEDLFDIKQREALERKLDAASIQEILLSIQNKFFNVESRFINKSTFQLGHIDEDIEDMLSNLGKETALGLPLNGDILSSLVMGARRGKVFTMSAESGAGKSRYAISNACQLAFPILWNHQKGKWDNTGSNQKIIFITTELSRDEVQTIAISFVSGVNEDRILNNTLTQEERTRVRQAVNVFKTYKDNFLIYLLPDPNVAQLNVNVRRYVITHQLDAVFFDYIHSSPNLLAEFSGMKVREDVALMLLSTALKNLANELGVFVWSATQVNSNLTPGEFAGVECVRG